MNNSNKSEICEQIKASEFVCMVTVLFSILHIHSCLQWDKKKGIFLIHQTFSEIFADMIFRVSICSQLLMYVTASNWFEISIDCVTNQKKKIEKIFDKLTNTTCRMQLVFISSVPSLSVVKLYFSSNCLFLHVHENEGI